jgi:transcriptional regulator with XRE-family HTH domain
VVSAGKCLIRGRRLFVPKSNRTLITVFNAHGLTQGQIAGLTGIAQGRLSEWTGGKRKPQAVTTFQAFADGLGMPTAARQALGLGPAESASLGTGLSRSHAVPDVDVGLEYPGTPTQAAGNVSMLWEADVSDPAVLERGVIAPAAWNEASLRWLIASADRAVRSGELRGGVQIGLGDVERFQASVMHAHNDTDAHYADLDWRGQIQYLEETYPTAPLEVKEVIVTSFLMNMPWPAEPGYAIVAELGPALAEKFRQVRPAG